MEASTALTSLRARVEDASSTPAGTASALVAGDIDPLTVVFVLPGLGDGGSGGSHSIYQEVRGLRQLGVNARVALIETAFPRAMNVYEDAAEIFQTFADEDDLVDKTQDADVISATHFKSVAMVARVREARDDFLPAYYIQDYEPFFADSDSASEREAIASYTAIDDMLLFAKTHWLCNVVARVHGLHVAKVEPSIDEQLFVPPLRPRDPDQPIRITAMVRPRTPRRQPFGTVAVLQRVQEAYPDKIEVVTFGCNDAELAKITDSAEMRARHLGLLARHRVASLLASSDIFLDLSMYQAFGRTALEAMACGCTAVAPRLGGVWEFARDGENMLVVDTLDESAAFDALVSLIDDRARLSRLQASARETAARYSILRAALSEYVVFEQEHARRFGHGFRRSRVRGTRGA
jgi:glycosyltransferase involved in cell wall biosynthesis